MAHNMRKWMVAARSIVESIDWMEPNNPLRDVTLATALARVTHGTPMPGAIAFVAAAVAYQQARAASAEISQHFQSWLETHPLRKLVDSRAPWHGSPATTGLDSFFMWCAKIKRRGIDAEWRKAGDTLSVFIDPDRTTRYVELVGEIKETYGRAYLDTAVDEYIDERTLLLQHKSPEPWQQFQRSLRAMLDLSDADCTLIALGHMAWYLLDDLRNQNTEDYHVERELRADAGMSSPPPATKRMIFKTIARYLEHSELSHKFIERYLVDRIQSIPDFDRLTNVTNVIDLCNTIFRTRLGLEPWWIRGYQDAINTFGAETTLGELAVRRD